MARTIGAIVAGLVVWILVATILNFGLRAAIPGYHAVEKTFVFTLPMMVGRLAIGALSSIAAGAAAQAIARASRAAPWIVGIVLLAMFLPEHIHIGARLPLWYHLFFLATLIPFVGLGAQLASRPAV